MWESIFSCCCVSLGVEPGSSRLAACIFLPYVSLSSVLCPSCHHQSYRFHASCLVFIFFLCVFTPMCYSCCCLFSPFYLLLGIQYNFESAVRMLCSELCSQPIQRLLDALHTAHPTQASAVPELNEQKKFLENSQPIRIQVEPAGAG